LFADGKQAYTSAGSGATDDNRDRLGRCITGTGSCRSLHRLQLNEPKKEITSFSKRGLVLISLLMSTAVDRCPSSGDLLDSELIGKKHITKITKITSTRFYQLRQL